MSMRKPHTDIVVSTWRPTFIFGEVLIGTATTTAKEKDDRSLKYGEEEKEEEYTTFFFAHMCEL